MKRKFMTTSTTKVTASYDHMTWLDEDIDYPDGEVYEDYVKPILYDVLGRDEEDVREDLISLAYECESANEFRDKVTDYLKTELGFSR